MKFYSFFDYNILLMSIIRIDTFLKMMINTFHDILPQLFEYSINNSLNLGFQVY